MKNKGRDMDVLREFWTLFAGGFAVVVWLVRLEARGVSNAAEIKRLWTQRKEDMEAAKHSRDKSDRRLDEIAQDIKEILRGMAK
jgi:hypothetical protein